MSREIVIEYLQEQERLPFAWGSTDCMQFASGIVQRLTGVDYAAKHPKYSTEREAIRMLAAAGGMRAFVEAELGPMRRDLPNCADGDIVLTAFAPQGQALGVALPRLFFLRTETAIVPIDMTLAIGYWPCRRS